MPGASPPFFPSRNGDFVLPLCPSSSSFAHHPQRRQFESSGVHPSLPRKRFPVNLCKNSVEFYAERRRRHPVHPTRALTRVLSFRLCFSMFCRPVVLFRLRHKTAVLAGFRSREDGQDSGRERHRGRRPCLREARNRRRRVHARPAHVLQRRSHHRVIWTFGAFQLCSDLRLPVTTKIEREGGCCREDEEQDEKGKKTQELRGIHPLSVKAGGSEVGDSRVIQNCPYSSRGERGAKSCASLSPLTWSIGACPPRTQTRQLARWSSQPWALTPYS